MTYALAFAHGKRITEYCLLWDTLNGNIAVFNVDKWRHSDVIVIKLTAGTQHKIPYKMCIWIFHTLKITKIMLFCILFMERPSYFEIINIFVSLSRRIQWNLRNFSWKLGNCRFCAYAVKYCQKLTKALSKLQNFCTFMGNRCMSENGNRFQTGNWNNAVSAHVQIKMTKTTVNSSSKYSIFTDRVKWNKIAEMVQINRSCNVNCQK